MWQHIQLPGTIGAELFALSSLTTLVIRWSNVRGSLEGIERLTNLRELMLDWSRMSGTIPTTIGSLRSLETLVIDRMYLSGPVPTSVGQLTRLRSLNMNFVDQLDKRLPREFFSLTALTQLALMQCGFAARAESFAEFTSLKVLHLAGNALTGSGGGGVG